MNHVKSQTVRLLDVFLYGPFLMYASTTKKLTSTTRIGLVSLGIGTIIYNWVNYVKIQKQESNSRFYT